MASPSGPLAALSSESWCVLTKQPKGSKIHGLQHQVSPAASVDFVQADRLRRRFAHELATIFEQVDVLLVPSLRDETLTTTNFTGHPSLTLRTGFVHVSEARSDWAPDPKNPVPTFANPRRVPLASR